MKRLSDLPPPNSATGWSKYDKIPLKTVQQFVRRAQEVDIKETHRNDTMLRPTTQTSECINPDLWKNRLRPLEVEQQQGYYDTDWTWTTGGCFAFAEAFQEAFGGEFYGVCRVSEEDDDPDLPVDHALVLHDGIFYDHDGSFDPLKILDNQVIRHRDDDYVFWFEDDFFDDDQFEVLKAVLRDCAENHVSRTASSPNT